MEKKKYLSWINIFALAGTFFGIIVNAAFVTGGLAYSYFAKYGWCCLFLPIVSFVLMVFTYWTAMNAAVNHNCRSGREWADWLYAPYNKILGPIYDFVTVSGYCMALATGIAGMATLLSGWWGWNYTATCIIYGIIIIVIAMGNSKTISKLGGIMCAIIAVCMLFIYPQIISANSQTLSAYVGGRVMFEDFTIWDALWRSAVWYGFQCISIGPMVALHRDGGYSTRKDARRIIIAGGIISAFFLILNCLVVLSTLPESATAAPILTAMEMLDKPLLFTVYRICMLFALISSNGPGLYGMGGRWALQLKKPESFKARMLISSLCLMALSLFLSTFGLMTLISKGWAYMGTVGILVYGIPSFTIGLKKSLADNKNPKFSDKA